MVRLRIPYRDRIFALDVGPSQQEACMAELLYLHHHAHYLSGRWYLGQFESMLEALQCVFQSDSQGQIRLWHQYRGGRVTLTLPVQFYFRGVVLLGGLLSSESCRSEALSLAELRHQVNLKCMVVVGSSASGSIFAWGQAWSLVSPTLATKEAMEELWLQIATAPWHEQNTVFARLWRASVALLDSAASTAVAAVRLFGRTWSFSVPMASVVEVQLALERLLFQCGSDSVLWQREWERLRARWAALAADVVACVLLTQCTRYRVQLTTVYHQSSCWGSKGPKSMARNRSRDLSDLGAFLWSSKQVCPYPGGLPLSLLRYHANFFLDTKGTAWDCTQVL